MLDNIFDILRKDLTAFLKTKPDLTTSATDPVVLTRIMNNDGSIDIPEGTIGLTLVNIEEETTTKSQIPYRKNARGKIEPINPEILLNLYILVSVRFSTYKTGLKLLSAALGYFQANPIMTPDRTPELDHAIDRISFELYTMSFEEQNHLFGSLGAKYLPSVLYKARIVTVQESKPQGEQEPIFKADIAAGRMG